MKRFWLLGVVLAGLLVACGGGGGSSTPPTSSTGGSFTGSTATPSPSPSPTPTAPPASGSGQVAVSTSTSAPFTLPPVGGYTGSVTFPAASVSTSLTVADSTSPQNGVAVQGTLRRAIRSWSTVTAQSGSSNTAMVYISVTASVSTSLNGTPTLTFALPSPAPSGPFYLASYANGQWETIQGPGVVSGSTVTFAGTSGGSGLGLTANTPFYLAFYTGGVIATPTPSPSASPTASPTPAPSSSPLYACNNTQFLADQASYADGGISTNVDSFEDICGSVTSVLAEQDTSSGHHGYFYVEMPSGYLIEIVSNLDAMAENGTSPPPTTWPWVAIGNYVYVQGRYYYDNANSQGIDWTENDTSNSWPHVGYVVVNGAFYN